MGSQPGAPPVDCRQRAAATANPSRNRGDRRSSAPGNAFGAHPPLPARAPLRIAESEIATGPAADAAGNDAGAMPLAGTESAHQDTALPALVASDRAPPGASRAPSPGAGMATGAPANPKSGKKGNAGAADCASRSWPEEPAAGLSTSTASTAWEHPGGGGRRLNSTNAELHNAELRNLCICSSTKLPLFNKASAIHTASAIRQRFRYPTKLPLFNKTSAIQQSFRCSTTLPRFNKKTI